MTGTGSKPRLVVSRRLPPPAIARAASEFDLVLHDSEAAMPPAELGAAARGADALLVMAMDRIDAAFIEALPAGVKVLATLSVGHEHIDLDAARARGLAVLNTPDILSEAVAEMGMLLLLGAGRRAREGDLLLRSGSSAGRSPAWRAASAWRSTIPTARASRPGPRGARPITPRSRPCCPSPIF